MRPCRSSVCGSARGRRREVRNYFQFSTFEVSEFCFLKRLSAVRYWARLSAAFWRCVLDFLGFSERSKSANGEKRDVRGEPPSTRREEAGGALGSDFHSRGDFGLGRVRVASSAAKSRRFSRSFALVGFRVGAPRSDLPVDFFGGLFCCFCGLLSAIFGKLGGLRRLGEGAKRDGLKKKRGFCEKLAFAASVGKRKRNGPPCERKKKG